MTNCPSDATLRSIGTDIVGDATFARLEGHVEQCHHCQEILEAAMRAGPHSVRAAPTRTAPPTLPGLVIERELGRGGTSVVYLAREPGLKRDVAVKLFPRNSLVDPQAREHWIREAWALSRVPHAHVVTIHRVGESEEWLWLVIEYVSGGTLKDRLMEPLPPGDAARLAQTIARVVAYFHARGVCHLDLKPSNILLAGEFGAPWELVSPKISDFGIARLEGEPGATETGANGPKGTPSYMAPEQVAALPGTIGPAADLHALGAVLYHLLTGRPPFQGATSAETLDQVRNQDPVPPRRLNGRIPRDLETICLTCLEKVPSRRYRSAEALAGDIRLFLEGRPIGARRVTPVGHAWRWCRRHPSVATLLLTLATTLAAGVVGLFVLLKQAEAERARLAAARRHAEAYEQFSASVADQVGRFLCTMVLDPGPIRPDQMTAALLKLRDAANDLKARGIVPTSALGTLEQGLGRALEHASKPEEARVLLDQAVVDLKLSLAKNPEDSGAWFSLEVALISCGMLAMEGGQFDNSLDAFEQAAGIQIERVEREWKYSRLTDLYLRVQILADRIELGGRTDQTERSRRLSRQIVEHLLGSDLELWAGASPPGLETLGRLFQLVDLKKMPSGENQQIRRSRENSVCEWLTLSVRSRSPFHSSSAAVSFDRDPEAGAIALIAEIREKCSKLGLADSMVSATMRVVIGDALREAAGRRKQGRHDDARATATRLLTIARRLVREYPEDAHAYGVLSEAHDQIKKNAFQTGDDDLVEQALVRAVEAGQRAVSLHPDWTEPRRQLDRLSGQLASIRADRNAARPSLSSSSSQDR